MRQCLTFLLTILISVTYAQDFAYPSLILKEHSITDFVPAGWAILDSAHGDLNKDGINDAAIILQHQDSVLLINKLDDTVLTQPRILFILFKNPSSDSFALAAQTNSFILKHDNAAMDDPFQGLEISNGAVQIKFQLFYNMGSWYVTNAIYKFSYNQGQFVLTGADYSSYHRASLDFEDYSYNFLTKKRLLTKGNENKRTKKTTSKKINIAYLKTFVTFTEPFTWEVEQGIYL